MIDDATRKMFGQKFGPKLDALEIAMAKYHDGDKAALGTIISLTKSVLVSGHSYELSDVVTSAALVLRMQNEALPHAVHKLIRTLRHGMSSERPASVILIVGGAPNVSEALAAALSNPNHKAVWVWTAAEAHAILKHEEVVFMILNLFLPDVDGRKFLQELCADPATSNIPRLIIDELHVHDWIIDNGLLLGADGYTERPIDLHEVTEQIRTLLRLAHRNVNAPARDPLTGLLNPHALREAHAQARRTCEEAGDSLTLAYVALSSEDMLACPPAAWDKVVEQIGHLLSHSVRATDIAGRWGMNEFVILLPGTDETHAIIAADTIRKRIEQAYVPVAGTLPNGLHLSVGSAGLAQELLLDVPVDRALHNLQMSPPSTRGLSFAVPHGRPPRRALLLHDLRSGQNLKRVLERLVGEVVLLGDATGDLTETLNGKRPHLIIIDEMVPGGGLVALAALRALHEFGRIPILMLLRPHSQKNVVKALELGASDFLTLPFSPVAFTTCIDRLLVRHDAHGESSSGTCEILVADEDAHALLTSASALHQHGGIIVHLARTADDAIRRATDKRLSAVIMDPTMLHSDGRRLLDVLRSVVDPLKTAVIAAMDADSPSVSASQISTLVRGILTKPYDPLTMVHELEVILGFKFSRMRPANAVEQLNLELQRLFNPNHTAFK